MLAHRLPRTLPWSPAPGLDKKGEKAPGTVRSSQASPPRNTQWEGPSQSFRVLQYMLFSSFFFFNLLMYFFKKDLKKIFNWRMIAFQCCVGFCHMTM